MSLIHCSVSDVLHNCYDLAEVTTRGQGWYDPAEVTTRGQGYKIGVVTTRVLCSLLAVTHTTCGPATTLSVISEF